MLELQAYYHHRRPGQVAYAEDCDTTTHEPPEQTTQGLVWNKKECYRNYDIDRCQHYSFKPITSPIMYYQIQYYCC